jgi:hypothetical protein
MFDLRHHEPARNIWTAYPQPKTTTATSQMFCFSAHAQEGHYKERWFMNVRLVMIRLVHFAVFINFVILRHFNEDQFTSNLGCRRLFVIVAYNVVQHEIEPLTTIWTCSLNLTAVLAISLFTTTRVSSV